MDLPVLTAFTALVALLSMGLTGRVGLRRGATGGLRGHGGDAVRKKRIRIHGNFM